MHFPPVRHTGGISGGTLSRVRGRVLLLSGVSGTMGEDEAEPKRQ